MDRISKFWKQALKDLNAGKEDSVHAVPAILAMIVLGLYNFIFLLIVIISYIEDGVLGGAIGRAFIVNIILSLNFLIIVPYIIGGKLEE